MSAFQLLVSPSNSGRENMRSDLRLFNDFESGTVKNTLRIYSWEPKCISLGYSQEIDEEIDLPKAKALGWDVVERPTGGGIVFHNEAEITYSLMIAKDDPLLPEGMIASYRKISGAIVCALQKIGVGAEIHHSSFEIRNSNPQLCFSYPAEYEITAGGKKIVGSAQKRGKRALLQQGSIFVRQTEASAFSVLKKPYEGLNAVSVEEVVGRKVGFDELKEALLSGFKEKLGIYFDD